MRNPQKTEPMTLLNVIKNGYLQQVRFLVDQGVNLNQRDKDRKTALMLCAFIEPESWGIGICRLLIENGACLDYKDKHGLNAFHYAVIYERVELVQVYLNAIDFDLNEGDALGNTALHYAVRADNAVITRSIAQAYVIYKITFDKVNKAGCTPLQEARRLNNTKCARILENFHVMRDNPHAETHASLDFTDNECDQDATPQGCTRRSKKSRPLSNVFSRRSSKTTLNTSSDYTQVKLQFPYSNDANHTQINRRDPFAEISPHEKSIKQMIRCASASDIRNNPEYLFHLEPSNSSFPTQMEQNTPKQNTRAKSAFVRPTDVAKISLPTQCTWRQDFGKLYNRLQYQCTSSYRYGANTIDPNEASSLPPIDKCVTQATSEHAFEDDKGKKRGKWATLNRVEDVSTKSKLHLLHKTVSRKNSQVLGHVGKTQNTNELESSNESIHSSVSLRKHTDIKFTKIARDIASGRVSRMANSKMIIPSLNVEDVNPDMPNSEAN